MASLKSLALVPVILFLSACASDPPPREQLRLTGQAIEQTRSLLGEDRAALGDAEATFAAARQAHERQAYREARRLAERAELDARLVEARTLTARSRQQAIELRARIAALRQQLGEMP